MFSLIDDKSLNVGARLKHQTQGNLIKQRCEIQDDPKVYHEIKTLEHRQLSTIRWKNWFLEEMDFKIPGLPHSIVKQAHSASVAETALIQNSSRTIQTDIVLVQRDLRQSHSTCVILSLSRMLRKQMIQRKLGTSNCVNYSTRTPKRSAKYVYHTGTLASSKCTCKRTPDSCEAHAKMRKDQKWSSNQVHDGLSFQSAWLDDASLRRSNALHSDTSYGIDK